MNAHAFFAKAEPTLSARRLLEWAERLEPGLRRAFATYVAQVSSDWDLKALEGHIARGDIDSVLATVLRAGGGFAAAVNQGAIAAGQDTGAFLGSTVGLVVNFDQTNDRAVRFMQENRLRLIRELADSQRDAIRVILTEGVTTGLNPKQQAVAVRGVIGLTGFQANAVANYRRLLQQGSAEALERALRDRRFDRTVRRAVRGDRPLDAEQIDRMVSRYHTRYVAYRATVIARTESLRVVHQGAEEMFEQAIGDGQLDRTTVVRRWITAQDRRVRDSHGPMHGQERAVGIAFTSANGIALRYPGDPSAPASETVQCRCAVTTRVRRTPTVG